MGECSDVDWTALSDDDLLEHVLSVLDQDPHPKWVGEMFRAIRAAGIPTQRDGAREAVR
ncbi:hypothetical protein HDA32_006010 [Spinactinospora alkalitolerans]|uniref:Uncharacterized protein n=1 Tax=Spinactinospora alkalitolerans TaxID=687207 RepID=A0A852UA94_9ACTN|nr:hypothetical protein [Spinactinospora alkalitolerans]NYE50890.1 hypothetical protein [Spinactinospora alkalitolerans]